MDFSANQKLQTYSNALRQIGEMFLEFYVSSVIHFLIYKQPLVSSNFKKFRMFLKFVSVYTFYFKFKNFYREIQA